MYGLYVPKSANHTKTYRKSTTGKKKNDKIFVFSGWVAPLKHKMNVYDLHTVQPVVMTEKWRCGRCGPELLTEALDRLNHLQNKRERHKTEMDAVIQAYV